ncbi:MAG: lysophospholipid acyltransferase family protein [Acidobacteriota bacterium]
MTAAGDTFHVLRWAPIYLTIKAVTRVVLTSTCRLIYTGRENVPATGPLILVANHESYLDPFLIGAGLPRRPYYLVYHTYCTNRMTGPFVRAIGGLPVGGSFRLASVTSAETALRTGAAVEIFAEGERTDPGVVLPFHRGFARLARVTTSPVLPIAILGAGRIWPRDHLLPRPGRVEVHFGSPLPPPPNPTTRATTRQVETTFADDVRRAVLDLSAGRLVGRPRHRRGVTARRRSAPRPLRH